MNLGWLVNDRSETFGLHDRPDEENDTSGGCYDGLQGEKVATSRRSVDEYEHC